MTEWRLSAFEAWEKMEEPEWPNVKYKKPDFQKISYYSAPKTNPKFYLLDKRFACVLMTFKGFELIFDQVDAGGGAFS